MILLILFRLLAGYLLIPNYDYLKHIIVLHELQKYRFMQSTERRPDVMQIFISAQPVVALIAGIMILLVPKLLNYIIAFYLIIIGILGLIR